MNLVGHGNCWDEYANSSIPGEENLDNLFSILDFPIESLEGNECVEDWDISKSQCLGPIPSDVLMEPLMNNHTTPCLSSPQTISIGGAQELKVSEYLRESSSSDNLQRSNRLDSRISQDQSPDSVLEISCPCFNWRSSLKARGMIPVKARAKRLRAVVNPWLALSPMFAAATLLAISNAKREKQQRKKTVISHQPVAKETKFETLQKVENSQLLSPDEDKPAAVVTKKCAHCEVTKTPQWREGPSGPKTLCNACGVRYRSGRLFPEYRPAASPTFIPTIHSNSHKKVIEMRSKAKRQIGSSKIDLPPMPSVPEFAPKTKNSFLFEYF